MHMKLLITTIAMSLALFSLMSFEQNPVYDFEKAWKEVAKFEKEKLPKSAREKVEEIYEMALRENNQLQITKSTIYKAKFELALHEDGFARVVRLLESEIERTKAPSKQVLQTVTARVYHNYLLSNLHKIQQRTTLQLDDDKEPENWSTNVFTHRIRSLVHASIENPESTDYPLEEYKELVQNYSNEAVVFKPSLYDLLVDEAIVTINAIGNMEVQPSYVFSLKEPEALGNVDEFNTLNFETRDTNSSVYLNLKLFQKILGWNKAKGRKTALFETDLQRLTYVYSHIIHGDKDSLYLKQLNQMTLDYEGQPQYSMLLYHLSQYYYNKGAQMRGQGYHEYFIKSKEYADQIIQDFPKTEGARSVTHIYNNLYKKTTRLHIERITPIDAPILAQVHYKNVNKLFLKLLRLSDEEVKNFVDDNQREARKKLLNLKSIRDWSVDLPLDGSYRLQTAEFAMEGLPNGNYVLISASNNDFDAKESAVYFAFFQSTNIGYAFSPSNSGAEIRVMDRITGAPLKAAKLDIYDSFYNRNERRNVVQLDRSVTTNDEGIANLKGGRDHRQLLHITHGEDSNFFNHQIYTHWNNNSRARTEDIVFTDRSIYRPGQTLHYKVLSLDRDARSIPKISPNRNLEITLKDANYQEVSKQKLTTNAFGACAGTFVLPEGVLKGNMKLSVNGRQVHSFRVEEYKRPKFYVEIDTLSTVYQLNDDVKINAIAKTFAGTNLDGAQVFYRVYRQAHFPYYYWRRPISGQSEMEIINGNLETDADGKVQIEFKAIPDASISSENKPVYHYRVVVDITDINGETQSKSKTVIIGTLSRQIHLDISQEIERRDKKSLSIAVKDHNGALQASKGNLTLYKQEDDPRFYKQRYWSFPDTVLLSKREFESQFPDYRFTEKKNAYNWEKLNEIGKISFDTAKDKVIELDQIKESGSYIVKATVIDKNGEEIEKVATFNIYDEKNDRYPRSKIIYSKESKKELQPGEKYSLKLATSEDVLNVFYKIEKRNTKVDSKWIKLDKSSEITCSVEDEDRGGFLIHYAFIKNNRYYSQNQKVNVPWKNKDLEISFTSIRNKVLPGAEEEIQIKIKGDKKDKVAAELLAGMYDASLDQFVSHSWEKRLYPEYYSRMNENAVFFHQAQNQQFYFRNRNYNKFEYKGKNRVLPNLNYFELIQFTIRGLGQQWFNSEVQEGSAMMGERRMEKSAAAPMMDQSLPTKDIGAIAATSAGISNDSDDNISIRGSRAGATDYYIDGVRVGDGGGGSVVKELKDIPVRSNLNETVFFFPELKTDEQGNVIFSYKMNEALTSWNLFAFAHDKDLRYGFAKQEIVTQKDIMVFPNPPRFFRDNDKITFSAKVSNISDKDLSVDVQLDLFDAVSMEKVDSKLALQNKTQTIQISKGGSGVVKWNLNIPNRELDALNYKVIAQAGKHTDGEENTIPILTDRVLVTETLPFTVNPNSTKKVRFEKMANSNSTTLVHENFALEYTSNPAWYAVQALPYLMKYPYKCTEQVMNRYYANTLASHISNAHPRIKSVFDQWKREDSDALISNLEKNQELKSALLKETPWVLAAKSETEQKKNIALLFDLNKMASEKKKAIQTIRDRQLYNGGFPWFTGGRADRYITQNVLETIGHLVKLNVVALDEDPNLLQIVNQGISYIDKELEKEYQRISNLSSSADNLSYLAAHYLYVRSFFKDIEHQGGTKTSFDYYLNQAKRNAINRGIYHTAMLTLTLHRFGDTDKANELKKSLLERAFEHEELGLYWNEGNGYNWYELPIERHSLLLETMSELGEPTEKIDKMKLWLLRSKHTNNWKTTKATSSAIYALLIENEKKGMSSWITEDDATEFSISGKALNFDKEETGTAYVKKSWSKTEITPELTELEVKNNNDHVGWGSMYWQYFEEMDKVESFEETPLKLKKQLYKVVYGDKGEELIALDGGLKIGDKIVVRIELVVDRTMEYVHMKDMRASGLEPINVLSSYKWGHGLGYYESTGDLSTDFFFSRLPKGSYVFEYPLRAQHAGDFSNGLTTIQCMYAPEYTSHSQGIEIKISD